MQHRIRHTSGGAQALSTQHSLRACFRQNHSIYMHRLGWVPGLILRVHLHTRCGALRRAAAGVPKQAPAPPASRLNSAYSVLQAPARGAEAACLEWARRMASRRGGRGGGGRGRGRGGLAPGQRPVSETQRISIADQLSIFQRSAQIGALRGRALWPSAVHCSLSLFCHALRQAKCGAGVAALLALLSFGLNARQSS